ncbi:hypothetical protein TcasGA2_TC000080 [Tribolium castaneum]|uniref:RING-type domain-containing protein n=1 Tax=Tribolium castaneum TaxID=7070 RepID=D6WIR1_TRICA|nr:hypothetical protein TcasGA2_TC000080 [Tribolium castaneum]
MQQQHHHHNDILQRYPEVLVSLRRARCCRRLLRSAKGRLKKEKLCVRRLQSALFDAMDASRNVELFTCPLCRSVLKGPVTVECGHTFCYGCLQENCDVCGICDTEITANRCVNVLVQDLVDKWRDTNKIAGRYYYVIVRKNNDVTFTYRGQFNRAGRAVAARCAANTEKKLEILN